MTELKIHNDGKEKYQSFEAWLDEIDCEKGYGATEEEAIKEYIGVLDHYSKRVAAACQDLKLNSFEKIKVDWSGKEL